MLDPAFVCVFRNESNWIEQTKCIFTSTHTHSPVDYLRFFYDALFPVLHNVKYF